jgi:NAD(P)-dependent dehydrogenase (short-subunit alcohol dehydrogenase family)
VVRTPQVARTRFSDYAAAKAAVVYGLVRSLKNEIVRVAPAGRVNAVCPKGVRA